MRPDRGWRTALAAGLAAAALAAPACGAGGSGGDETALSMRDFDITLDVTSVPAGSVTFVATNDGPSVHEFEIFSVPDAVDATDLPVRDNTADTDAAELEIIDEVEDIAPSTSARLSVSLDAGDYAAICNLPGHYAKGMVATFTVR
jgi:uncharacterized cupredoxin-like copper-binding protein